MESDVHTAIRKWRDTYAQFPCNQRKTQQWYPYALAYIIAELERRTHGRESLEWRCNLIWKQHLIAMACEYIADDCVASSQQSKTLVRLALRTFTWCSVISEDMHYSADDFLVARNRRLLARSVRFLIMQR
jgi:hypothetical protein